MRLASYRESMSPEEAERVKRSDCIHYEDVCLELAVRANWAQFCCVACRAYRPIIADVTMVPNNAGPDYAYWKP